MIGGRFGRPAGASSTSRPCADDFEHRTGTQAPVEQPIGGGAAGGLGNAGDHHPHAVTCLARIGALICGAGELIDGNRRREPSTSSISSRALSMSTRIAYSAFARWRAMTASSSARCSGNDSRGPTSLPVEISKLVRSSAPMALPIYTGMRLWKARSRPWWKRNSWLTLSPLRRWRASCAHRRPRPPPGRPPWHLRRPGARRPARPRGEVPAGRAGTPWSGRPCSARPRHRDRTSSTARPPARGCRHWAWC